MTDRDDGGPAFPLADSNAEYDRTNREHCNGMTLRDYFAAKAIQGMYAADSFFSAIPMSTKVVEAYAAADAMLEEREK